MGVLRRKENPDESEERIIRRIECSRIVKEKFITTKHRYEKFEILLMAYFVEIEIGTILTFEHTGTAWLRKKELSSLDWAAVDIPIVNELLASSFL